jgi:hypothetical protein
VVTHLVRRAPPDRGALCHYHQLCVLFPGHGGAGRGHCVNTVPPVFRPAKGLRSGFRCWWRRVRLGAATRGRVPACRLLTRPLVPTRVIVFAPTLARGRGSAGGGPLRPRRVVTWTGDTTGVRLLSTGPRGWLPTVGPPPSSSN